MREVAVSGTVVAVTCVLGVWAWGPQEGGGRGEHRRVQAQGSAYEAARAVATPAESDAALCDALQVVLDAAAAHAEDPRRHGPSGTGIDVAMADLADLAVASGDTGLVDTVVRAYQGWFIVATTRDLDQATLGARRFGAGLEALARRCAHAGITTTWRGSRR